MSKIIDNFIILDQENITVITGKRNQEIYYYKNSNELDPSLLNKKKTVLLISAKQIYFKNLIFNKKVKNKIEELVKTKFVNLLAVPESELYYSYFVDEDKENINVLCFAVNKSLLDEKYEIISNLGIKIKAVFPIPLLYFLRYRQEEKYKEKRESQSNSEDKAFVYINELADTLYFTVFYSSGVYLHSCSTTNYKNEIIKIEEYFNEHLNISRIIVCNNEEIDPGDLLNNIDKKALRQLNILKILPVEKKKQGKRYQIIITTIIFLLILINSMSIYNYFQYKSNLLEMNREQFSELQPAIEYLHLLQREVSISSEQVKTYKSIVENRKTYLAWINEINIRLPLDVTVNNLIFKDDTMVLEGTAHSASKSMELLQESKLFCNLEFVGGITIENGREKFKIAGDLVDE